MKEMKIHIWLRQKGGGRAPEGPLKAAEKELKAMKELATTLKVTKAVDSQEAMKVSRK